MDITGTVDVDGRPLGDVALALVGGDGRTVAVTRSDPEGRFSLPGSAAPPGAAPGDWYEVSVTPTCLDGVPAAALRTLTLDGMGPARSNAYHKVRVDGSKLQLRVLPGTYDVRAAHIVDRPKVSPPAPPNWVSGKATLPDGRTVDADLEYVPVDVHRDVEVRLTMVPVRD